MLLLFWMQKVMPTIEGTGRPEAIWKVKSVVKDVMFCCVLYQAAPAWCWPPGA